MEPEPVNMEHMVTLGTRLISRDAILYLQFQSGQVEKVCVEGARRRERAVAISNRKQLLSSRPSSSGPVLKLCSVRRPTQSRSHEYVAFREPSWCTELHIWDRSTWCPHMLSYVSV